MKKTTIIFGLGVTLSCVGALTGCGGSPDEDPNAASPGGATAGAPIKTKDGNDTIVAGNMAIASEGTFVKKR